MKFLKSLSRTRIAFGVLFLFVILFLSQNALGASTIAGVIYDKQRNALPDIEVELLDDFYRVVSGGRARTDGAGRYQFGGLSNGRYTVRVYAFRNDLEDQSQQVEINTQNVRGGEGSAYYQQDFYLLPKKGGLAQAELGVVFAQEIPQPAKKVYEKAVKDLSDKRANEGIIGLNDAIKLFPDYFLALHSLGKELFVMKRYKEAIPYFYKAAEINPKSATSFYYLGYSLYNMGKEYNKSAITSLNQAYTLAPSSMKVLYALGKVERAEGKLENAEKHLLQAKKLSKIGVPEIHKELAQLYANDLKKYKEAADELELYLKVSKPADAELKQTKKIINDLREKAKTQSPKS